jgi:hypothetical protein
MMDGLDGDIPPHLSIGAWRLCDTFGPVDGHLEKEAKERKEVSGNESNGRRRTVRRKK